MRLEAARVIWISQAIPKLLEEERKLANVRF